MTEAALSDAAARCRSRFGDEVSQPEAVRPGAVHSPFGRLEAVTPATVAASADWAHKDAIRGVGGMRDVRCGSLFLDAVLVQPAHLVSVPGWRALVSRPSSSHSTTSHDAR